MSDHPEPHEPWWQILGEWIWELIKTIATVFVLVYLIRGFLVQPFIIQGQSMEPNFHSGEYLLVERFSRLTHHFSRGDVVVFASDHGRADDFIKRIIGLPGETVIVRDNAITIKNATHPTGFRINEPYLPSEIKTLPENGQSLEVTLSPNQYFVFGDNRTASRDSRSFGPIEEKDIVGKAWLITFPLNYFGQITSPVYSDIISG